MITNKNIANWIYFMDRILDNKECHKSIQRFMSHYKGRGRIYKNAMIYKKYYE